MFKVPFDHFPAPPEFKRYKQQLLEIINADDNATHRLSPNGESVLDMKTDFFYNDRQRLYPKYMGIVQEALAPYIKVLSEKIGFPIDIETMWYQQTIRGQFHEVHTHGSVGISAIWYLEFDPRYHKSTTFYCPFPNPLTGDLINNNPVANEGDLIVFPSFLFHQQEPNDSDIRRTIISFNIACAPRPTYKHPA